MRGRPRFLLEALELFADGGQVALEREDLAYARTSRGRSASAWYTARRERDGSRERALPVAGKHQILWVKLADVVA